MTDLRSKLVIHPESLHKDAQEQPYLACEAAEAAAEAKAEVRRTKLRLEQIKADSQRKVRGSPGTFGIDKVTEAAIAAAVTADPDVSGAEGALIDAQEASDLAEAVASGFEHRRGMIHDEVRLWLANYWGDVTVREAEMHPDAQAVRERRVEDAAGRRRRRDDGP